MPKQRMRQLSSQLDKFMEHYGFHRVDSAITESTATASFDRGGMKADYSVAVKKDVDKGRFRSESEFELSVRVYPHGKPVELYPYRTASSNDPLPRIFAWTVDNYVGPEMNALSARALRTIPL